MRNNNISMLFSSLNKNNPIDYTAYSSIKSGSYKKLLKAHYAQDKEDKVDSGSKTKKNQSTLYKTDKDANELAKNAKSLKDSITKLDNKELWAEGSEARDKIVSAVKKFASDYNSVVNKVGDVKSSDVSKSNQWMQSLTGVMSNTLSRAGITVSTDGTLKVDEDKLKAADLKTVKSLFTGTHSYAEEIAKDATSIANAAMRSNSIYTSTGAFQSPINNIFDQGL